MGITRNRDIFDILVDETNTSVNEKINLKNVHDRLEVYRRRDLRATSHQFDTLADASLNRRRR